ncbi:patatin-like phospholipase family protein [Hyunsoonleella rubra]|uniref:Patatin-like phospholipase family protein n=1 Tax=Hyunsoonleella rubra TaxID=1737062 RepID=A0ABW5T6S7_9FLAO
MKKTIIISILFLFVFIFTKAQTNEQEEGRPKIGLVLSGGGAKGLAHVGVLKVIDSLGLKIDYVAGTSMGAIVGSLYASGYSGQELDSIFNSLDFDKVINDDLPRASKAFNERNNAERYAITLPFEDLKLKLPSALSRGQNTYNALTRLLLHVSDINEFKDLPIPYFCMATNIETGKPVQLESGNLPQAVMASGALPSLFQPVVIDDMVLIDGGVVNNYPIEELRAKDMDIIIGVDVQDGLLKRDELTSAPDVLLQINNFRTINDMKDKAQQTDVYIKPDITDFNVVSFSDAIDIIRRGEEAAINSIHSLRQLASEQKDIPKRKVVKNIQDTITINSVIVKGNQDYTRSYILGKLKLKNRQTLSYQKFTKKVNSLVATNNFESFYFQLKPTGETNTYDLIANVRESKATTFFKFGVHYDDLYKSAALVNLTKKRLLFKNDLASLDIILGDNVRYNFDYLIDKGFYWSVGVRSRYNQFEKLINAELLLDDTQIMGTGLNKIDVLLYDQTNQVYLETLFRRDFALSIGAEHKRLKIKSETIVNPNQDDFTFESTDYFNVFGGLKLDTYDNKYFPKKGVFFDGDLHMYLFASKFNADFDTFSIAKATMGYAFSISDKLSLNFQTSGGFKIGDKSTTTLDFALGGYGNNLINNFVPFYGYDFISLTGNSYVKAYASADFEIFNKNHITVEGNWANVEDDIFETGEWFTLPDYRGYALGYAYDSFLGPVQIKYSYSPEDNNSVWYFNLGFWF